MTNLEKELIETSKHSIENAEQVVQEAKLLLESNVAEERNLLRVIGLDAELEHFENKNSEVLEKRRIETKHGRSVLTLQQLKAFCLKYRLYMRPADKYRGSIPLELGAELKRYCDEVGEVSAGTKGYSSFYMIAPPKMFKGYQNPWNIFLSAVGEADEAYANWIKVQKDPILVYQENPDKYVVVKSWGSDAGFEREVLGFLTRRPVMKFFSFLTILLPWFLLGKVSAITFMLLPEVSDGHFPGWVVLWSLGVAIAVILSLAWAFGPGIAFRNSIVNTVTARNEGGGSKGRHTVWSYPSPQFRNYH